MKKFVDTECAECHRQFIDVFCEIPDYPDCPDCGIKTIRLFLPSSVPAVKGDNIPGGYWVKHGICNPDGSPKRYDSHSEIQKAAKAAGLANLPERGVADRKDWDKLSRRVGEGNR